VWYICQNDGLILMHYYQLKSIVCIKVHFLCCTFYESC
jgi:hypothetical protein